jgi:hypothetical protein
LLDNVKVFARLGNAEIRDNAQKNLVIVFILDTHY